MGLRRGTWSAWGATLVASLAALVWIAPYGWMVLTSLKTLPEITQKPAALPEHVNFGLLKSITGTLSLRNMIADIVHCIVCKKDVGPRYEVEITRRTFHMNDLKLSNEVRKAVDVAMGVPNELAAFGSANMSIIYTICKACSIPENIEEILRVKAFVANVNNEA